MTLLMLQNLGMAWREVVVVYPLYVPAGWTMRDRLPEWTMPDRLPEWTMEVRSDQ